MTGVLLKQVVHAAPTTWSTIWPLLLLLLCGATSIICAQSAYQAGALIESLPSLTVLEPVVAVVVASMAYGERLHPGMWWHTGQLAGMLLLAAGVTGIARAESRRHTPLSEAVHVRAGRRRHAAVGRLPLRLERDVAVRAAAGGRRRPAPRPAGAGSARGSITSSTTPISHAPGPPRRRSVSCSAASWACSASRSSGGAAASLLRCRMPTAAFAPITAISASGQANTAVAPSDAGVHRDVGAAVGLAGHQGHPRHHRLGEGVQQLRAAAHHAVPLLADAGQVAGHVDEHDQRDAERVAHPHEPRRLLRRRRSPGSRRAAAGCWRSRRRCGRPSRPSAGDDVRRPLGVQLHASGSSSTPVDQRRDVVGPLAAARAARRARSTSSAIAGGAGRCPGPGEQRRRPGGRGRSASASESATTCTTPDCAGRARPGRRGASMSTSSPVTERTTSGPVTNTRPSGAMITMSVSAGP